MTNEEVSDRITGFIQSEFLDGDPQAELNDGTPLLEWGLLNSANTAHLLSFIREDLGVRIPPREINGRNLRNIRTISSLVCGLADGA